jgi:FMN phosphatase YigB (HAD superfamily)
MTKGVVFDFDGTLTELTLDFNGMRSELEKVILNYVSLETLKEFQDHLMLELIYAIEKRLGRRGTAFRDEAFTLLRSIEQLCSMSSSFIGHTREYWFGPWH